MTEMSFLKKCIARELFKIGAIQDKSQSPGGKGFKLKLHEKSPGAPLSPFYLNFRTPDNPKPGPLTPDIIEAVGQELFLLACEKELRYDFVVGVPRAGDPIAEAFARTFFLTQGKPIPVLTLDKEETARGRRVVISNESSEIIRQTLVGDVPLLIDDLITQSHSKEEATSALEYQGLKPYDVLVLVDREQGGTEQLYKKGYRLHADFKFSGLLDFYLAERLMDKATYNEINAYLADNR